jgi:glycosyltransferase involved in cell wall biosynthesis
MRKDSITLLIMTLNEIDGVKKIMPQINKKLFDKILIVDGGSSDGTIEWLRKNKYDVYIQKQKGFRHAYQEVWGKLKTEYAVTFSPDGNSLVSKLPELCNELKKNKHEMIIVSRYLDDAKSYDDDFITSFGNKLFTRTTNLLYRGNLTDTMVIFRGYKTNLPKRLGLLNDRAYEIFEKVFCTKISWEPLLSVRVLKNKLKYKEIPGDEPPRIGGERKLQIIRWGLAYYSQILFDVFRRD